MTGLLWTITGFALLNIGILILAQVPSLAGAKTKIVALVTATLGAVQAAGITFLQDPTTIGVTFIGLGVTMAVLREVTKWSPR